MDNNKTINTVFNAELPASMDNAVKNLTDKPTLSIGTTFSDLWDLVFSGISYLSEKKKIEYAHKLNLYRKELEESIKQIPPEKLVEPSIQVTAQALENSKYCVDDDELRRMFTALISNSMNTDFSINIHPSFAEMIKQMSPLDAKIIALFKAEPSPGLPACQYHVTIPGDISSPAIPEHIFLEIPEGAISPNSMSLVSLSRFGLISISYLEHLRDETIYEKFFTHQFYKDLENYWSIGKISIQKGIVSLTPLGRSFVKVCIPD